MESVSPRKRGLADISEEVDDEALADDPVAGGDVRESGTLQVEVDGELIEASTAGLNLEPGGDGVNQSLGLSRFD